MREYIEQFCKEHDVPVKSLLGRRRKKQLVALRHKAMKALRAQGYTYQAIADEFSRDHTTVLYACKDEFKAEKKEKSKAWHEKHK